MGTLKGLLKEGAPAIKDKLLDMTRKARMERAREMGFDTERAWYHGSIDDIKTNDRGIWLTTDPQYADMLTEKPRVDLEMVRSPPYKKVVGGVEREFMPATAARGANITPVYASSNLKTIDLMEEGARVADEIGVPPPLSPLEAQDLLGGVSWDEAIEAEADWAIKEGYDGVRVLNFDDGFGRLTEMAYIPAPASKNSGLGIRSVNAAFDPDKKTSASLLAGGTAAAVGLGAGSQDAEAGAGSAAIDMAYSIGRKIGAKYGDLIAEHGFNSTGVWNRVAYDPEIDIPEALLDDRYMAFMQAGAVGDPMPRKVKGWRRGSIPYTGRSHNVRDDVYEPGVSVMEVYDGPATQDQLSAATVGDRPRVELEGYLHPYATGGDGEPLLLFPSQTKGSADAGLLGAIAGAGSAGLGALLAADKAFSESTAGQATGDALKFAFDAMELPSRYGHGVAAALGSLVNGASLSQALAEGARVKNQSIDEIARDLGEYTADKTGSPYAAALVDALTNVIALEP